MSANKGTPSGGGGGGGVTTHAALTDLPNGTGDPHTQYLLATGARAATLIELAAAGAVYFGDQTTNGTWRIVRTGNDLAFERRESAAWVEKGRITA